MEISQLDIPENIKRFGEPVHDKKRSRSVLDPPIEAPTSDDSIWPHDAEVEVDWTGYRVEEPPPEPDQMYIPLLLMGLFIVTSGLSGVLVSKAIPFCDNTVIPMVNVATAVYAMNQHDVNSRDSIVTVEKPTTESTEKDTSQEEPRPKVRKDYFHAKSLSKQQTTERVATQIVALASSEEAWSEDYGTAALPPPKRKEEGPQTQSALSHNPHPFCDDHHSLYNPVIPHRERIPCSAGQLATAVNLGDRSIILKGVRADRNGWCVMTEGPFTCRQVSRTCFDLVSDLKPYESLNRYEDCPRMERFD